MNTRPILFSGEMVRAILDGRKTQTRRIMKPQPIQNGFGPPDVVHDIPCYCDAYPPSAMLWPDERGGMLNGDAGHPWLGVDQLWVRETWRVHKSYDKLRPNLVVSAMGGDYRGCIDYLATPRNEPHWGKTRVSIFMPPEFSRIRLQVTGVRVERLNAISEKDALAEGVMPKYAVDCVKAGHPFTAVPLYQALWERINGAGSWAASPWVWVIEFRRITP